MRCNLTKLVRYIVVLVTLLVSLNIFIFLTSPHYSTEGWPDIKYLAGIRKLEGNDEGTRAPTTPPKVILRSSVTCPGLQMKELTDTGQFQPISPSRPKEVNSKLYVYSAFLSQGLLKVISLYDMTTFKGEGLQCQLWYQVEDGDPLAVVPAGLEMMPEGHGRKFTSSFVNCNLTPELRNLLPYAVSVVTDKCETAQNVLPVLIPSPKTLEFTVCVTPLNYRYSRAYELVENIEMNKILGAQKFVFYNHSTGPNVDKVLKMYSRSGEVEVLPWHLPMKTDTWPPSGNPEVHYFAQIAALNDCLYRHRNQSQYVVFTDLDEFIIPRQDDNWAEFIKKRALSKSNIAAFQFMCVFFRKEWVKPVKGFGAAVEKYNSVILKHSQREHMVFPHGSRSKLIVDPRLISTMGIHQVWRHHGAVDRVQENEAILHHYRSWENPNDPQPRLDDQTAADRFGGRLVDRLTRAWSKLQGVPLDINITTYGARVR